jgi:hypothetical protein
VQKQVNPLLAELIKSSVIDTAGEIYPEKLGF